LSSRFNGAAVHHGGVALDAASVKTLILALQWGRRSSRRSGQLSALISAIDYLASMGPPFITAEWIVE